MEDVRLRVEVVHLPACFAPVGQDHRHRRRRALRAEPLDFPGLHRHHRVVVPQDNQHPILEKAHLHQAVVKQTKLPVAIA